MTHLYQVQRIVGKRLKDKQIEYKVKWHGYPDSQSTWQPLKNLKNVSREINQFQKRNEKFLSKSLKNTPSLIIKQPQVKVSQKNKKIKPLSIKIQADQSDYSPVQKQQKSTKSSSKNSSVKPNNLHKQMKQTKQVKEIRSINTRSKVEPVQNKIINKKQFKKPMSQIQKQSESNELDELFSNQDALDAMSAMILQISQKKQAQIEQAKKILQAKFIQKVISVKRESGKLICIIQDGLGKKKIKDRNDLVKTNIDSLLDFYDKRIELPLITESL